jgi:hypothetical protein
MIQVTIRPLYMLLIQDTMSRRVYQLCDRVEPDGTIDMNSARVARELDRLGVHAYQVLSLEPLVPVVSLVSYVPHS